MITFAILILIVAKALPGLNTHISSIHITRITSIVFLFAGALSLNSLNLESIGSGIGIYSGLFQVTTISQLIEIFLFMIGGGILIAWPPLNPKDPLPPFGLMPHLLDRQRPAREESLFNLSPPNSQSLSLAYEGGREYVNLSLRSPLGESPPLREESETNLSSPLPLAWSTLKVAQLWSSSQHELPHVRKVDSGYQSGSKYKGTDYSIVVLFSSLGSSLLLSSYDLISVYLSIELQSFGLYVLSTLYRDSESSTSAGLKYFLLGGLSSCIVLLGTGIIYSYTGTTNLESLYIINSVIDALPSPAAGEGGLPLSLPMAGEYVMASQQYIIQGISLGLSLIFIGFLFKIAAAPLHNWSPDVYDGTPTIVTIWLTIIPKIAILFILLELIVKLGSFGPLDSGLSTIFVDIVINNNILKTLLLISATLSLIIGSLLGLAQIKIKRLLAYSTISHLGFILLALAVNTEESIDSFIFYIIQYTITNLNIFLIILGLTYCLSTLPQGVREGEQATPSLASPSLALQKGEETANLSTEGNKDISFISEFKGLFFKYPLLSISLAVSLFSMAGIPPLIGFFSKQLVLYSALQNGYYFISVLAIIVSVISCSYYLQIIKVLFTEKFNTDSITASPTPHSPPLGGDSPCVALRGRGSKLPASFGGKGCFSLSLAKGKEYVREGVEKNEILLTNTHSYLISTLTFTILLFFIKPSLILNSTQLLSLSLFYI